MLKLMAFPHHKIKMKNAQTNGIFPSQNKNRKMLKLMVFSRHKIKNAQTNGIFPSQNKNRKMLKQMVFSIRKSPDETFSTINLIKTATSRNGRRRWSYLSLSNDVFLRRERGQDGESTSFTR